MYVAETHMVGNEASPSPMTLETKVNTAFNGGKSSSRKGRDLVS